MLSIPTLLLLIALIFILSYSFLRPKQVKDGRKPPPGPPALPVIGNLHMLGKLPHRTLQTLSQKYGPIMSLRLGQVQTIVVSSPEAASLFLKTHDAVFASRPKTQASEYIFHGNNGVLFSEFGTHWRNMRKLCTSQLLSTLKVDMFAPIRKEELGLVVKSLEKAAAAREIVDLSEVVANLLESIMYKMILGRARDDRFDLKGLVHEGLSLIGALNVADYLPWLGAFDIQGLTKRLKKTSKLIDQVLEKIIEEHEQTDPTEQKGHPNDFIAILLSLMNLSSDCQSPIDGANTKAILFDMIAGSFETSAASILWAFSELLRHPRVMKNLQNELENTIGMSRMVDETDIEKLNYLDLIIKETFRLHPVAPLLLPREAMRDVIIDGFYIQKKSQILINAYTIGRDPAVWSDKAEVFYPERFVEKNINLGGNEEFKLIPFGSGRRGCPGMQLGLTAVKLVLAQLVHCFNWELPCGMLLDDLDMEEKFESVMRRAKHLLAVPTYRLA